MKTYLKPIIFCITLIWSVTLKAQTFTSKGTVELGGEFSFTSQSASVTGGSYYSNYSGGSADLLMFSPYVGAMIGQGFELGFSPSIIHAESSTLLNLFLAPAININTSGTAYPYFEGLIGYSSASGTGSIGGLGIGAGAGVKVTIGCSALFLFDLKYLHQSYEYDEPYYNYSFNGTSYTNNYTTLKVTETINTFFAGLGFRIFIAPKTSHPVPAQTK